MSSKTLSLRKRGTLIIDYTSYPSDTNQSLESPPTKSPPKVRDSSKDLLARISTKVTPISSNTFIKIQIGTTTSPESQDKMSINSKEDPTKLPLKLDRLQSGISVVKDVKLGLLNLNKTKRVPAALPNYRTTHDSSEDAKLTRTNLAAAQDEPQLEHACLSHDDNRAWLDTLLSQQEQPKSHSTLATLGDLKPVVRRRNKTIDLHRPNILIDAKPFIQRENSQPRIETSESSSPLIKLEPCSSHHEDSKTPLENALSPVNNMGSPLPVVRKEIVRKRTATVCARSLGSSLITEPKSVSNKEQKLSRPTLTLETSKATFTMNQTDSKDPCLSYDDNKNWLEALVTPDVKNLGSDSSVMNRSTNNLTASVATTTDSSHQGSPQKETRALRLPKQLEKSQSNNLRRQNTWETTINSEEMVVYKLAEEVVANYRSYQKYNELNGESQLQIKNILGQEGVLSVFIGKIGQHLPLSKRISRYILEYVRESKMPRASSLDKGAAKSKTDLSESPERVKVRINQSRFEVFQRINQQLQDFNMKFRMQGLRTLENTFIKAHENFRMKRKLTLNRLNRVSPEKYEQLKSQCDVIEGLMPIYGETQKGQKFEADEEKSLKTSNFTVETRTVNKKLDKMFRNLRSSLGNISQDQEDE